MMTRPYLKWSLPFICSCWQLNKWACIWKIIFSKFLVQPNIGQYKLHFLQQSMIHTLCHPILFCLFNSKVSNNTFVQAQIYKRIKIVLTSIIHFKPSYLPASLSLGHLLPHQKHIENFIFVMHHVQCTP